ncbi:MAG: aldehyde dehydrogenase [Lachnospiraceae bacterium]|nr:aldehyde dehydrogenase [Lachnospiraceae bacterium]
MTKQEIIEIIGKQRAYFRSGATLPVQTRINALIKLRALLQANEQRISLALKEDLGKSAEESYMCEIGMVISEITHMINHIKRYTQVRKVLTPPAQFPARSYQKPCPYGVVLVISPWNYPLLLTLDPLVDAIAAGNTVVVKPSAYSPATSALIKDLLEQIFSPEYVAVITGGREENTYLLEEKFDYIFFTGSKAVGQTVLAKAAPFLTPVTLELGGKSPCIVDESANLKLAARRIIFGKYLNCGQTCVAPDYLLCHSSVKEELLDYLKEELHRQYGNNALDNPSYGKIINEKHFQRILGLINTDKLAEGGQSNANTLQIQPTILDNVIWEDAVMQEEIFGPLLPILTYDTIEEVIDTVGSHDKPLALYLFSCNKHNIRRITSQCAYGGGCINDTIIHLATSRLGFGGVGESGMGSYHGKHGFDTFTHYKSIVHKKTRLDLPMRYQPYEKTYHKLVRFFLK